MDTLLAFLIQHKDVAAAFAPLMSATIAVIALFVSLLSVCLAYITFRHQRRHSILSMTPIPEVTVADFEDSLRVKLRNRGAGPLIVSDVHVGNGTQVKKSVIDWMPDGFCWESFAGDIRDRSILPGDEIILVRLDGDATDAEFVVARDRTRNALKSLTVNIEFTDVYNTQMKPYRKSLEWFGRHLDE